MTPEQALDVLGQALTKPVLEAMAMYAANEAETEELSALDLLRQGKLTEARAALERADGVRQALRRFERAAHDYQRKRTSS